LENVLIMEKGICDLKGKNYKIISKKVIVDGPDGIIRIDVEAPLVAKNTKAGQFIITHAFETSERIPLTIADYDEKRGTITLIFQIVGKSTRELGKLNEGEYILDLLGPLGVPVEVKKYEKPVICIGGGIGIAPIYPKVKKLIEIGNYVITIIGARTKGLLILEDELRKISSELYITTDDGSYGKKGFVTTVLREKLDELKDNIQEIIAVGPIPMMLAVVKEVAGKKYNETYKSKEDYKNSLIKTIVSLNPIMVDATGMCGGCRVNVWNPDKQQYEPKFTCVNGPAFDGHLIDFETLIKRNIQYVNQEKLT
jgi:ferredoxin--NADP+ reductase